MLTIPTKKLAEAVKACGVLATAKHIPILACVRIDAAGGVVTVDGTDLDIRLTMTVEGGDGDLPATCVDAQKLRSALAVGGSGDVSLKIAGEFLSIRGDGGSARLPTLEAREFPNMEPVGDPMIDMAVSGGDLSAALKAAAPAMSSEITRRYLCGITLWRDRDGPRLAASDGHMLIHARLLPESKVVKAGNTIQAGVVVPATTVRMLPDDAGEVTIKASRQRIEFSGGGWRVLSRLIDHEPIDSLERIVPARGACWADVDSAELIAAVERVAWASADRKADICMTLREGQIQIDAWNNLGQSASTTIDADVRLDGGGPMEIGFYAHVLLPVIRGMDSEVIGLSWAKGNVVAPVRIDAVGPKDGRRFGVAMPCRTNRPVEMKHAA